MNSRDLYLKLRPISKARPRSFRGQSRHTPPVYKNWLKDAKSLLEGGGPGHRWSTSDGSRVPRRAKGDLDNRLGRSSTRWFRPRSSPTTTSAESPCPMHFFKAKTANARINIKLTWEAQ